MDALSAESQRALGLTQVGVNLRKMCNDKNCSTSERAVERDGGVGKDLPPHLHREQHHSLEGDA